MRKMMMAPPAYTMLIVERLYSSWSLRAWLMFSKFDIPVKITSKKIYQEEFYKALEHDFYPSRQVPAVRMSDDTVIWDSLAIAEELNSRHPEKGLWPTDPSARAVARALTAEMHAGFSNLRGECSMNLHGVFEGFQPSPKVLEEAKRVEELWSLARNKYGQDGPWLFGKDYCVADAFYAPVAFRFLTYGLPRGKLAEDYIQQHVNDPFFRRWRAMGVANHDNITLPQYNKPGLKLCPWPGPTILEANPADDVDGCENTTCPYSSKTITHALETADGRKFGFCNAFCRDKTLVDPMAWPEFFAMYQK